MKLTVEVGLKKNDGPVQDDTAVRDALDEAIEGIGSIFAVDAEHDEESEFEITSVEVLNPGVG